MRKMRNTDYTETSFRKMKDRAQKKDGPAGLIKALDAEISILREAVIRERTSHQEIEEQEKKLFKADY